MNYHLKSLSIGPPGGWRYTQPETQFSMKAVAFYSLVRAVAQHRQNMKIELGNPAADVEAQICAQMSPEDQLAHCDIGIRDVGSIHWTLAQRFLTDLVGWLKIGFEAVATDEAERRAAICAKCPLNVGLHGCGSCRQALDAIRSTVMKLTTSKDAELQACGVCGCELKTAVHVPIEVLRKGQNELQFPDWCWQKPQP